MKILLISTGGTIASVKGENIHLDAPFKVIDYIDKSKFKNIQLEYATPFTVLSENMSLDLWQRIIDAIKQSDTDNIIILHGSDTLAFTSSLIAKLFDDKNIVLTASDKPVEDETSNAVANFTNALEQIRKAQKGVYVSYDGVYTADTIASADGFDRFQPVGKSIGNGNKNFQKKNILLIKPYVGIDYDNYNLENVDAVLHEMYHSATVPENAKAFLKKCEEEKIPFYFVTPKSSADYETAKDIKEKIIFNSTTENAYALLCTGLI